MRIGRPEILQLDQHVTYKTVVELDGRIADLWYSVDKEFGGLVSGTADAALIALLIPAMRLGEDIEVAGTVSERLLYTLSRPYQAILRHMNPSLTSIRIRAENITREPQRASGVATGFSGGIDSYCLLADHYQADAPSGFRITHLLYNNVGSHGKGGTNLFQKRYERLRESANRIGLPFIKVDSNLNEFYTEGDFQATHTPRNTSVAHLLGKGIGRFMYASAYRYTDVFVGPTDFMAYTDTLTLPLLSSEQMDVHSTGSEYTRVEKTLRTSDVPESYDSLDVCVSTTHAAPPINCSKCWKCLRTLLTLEIAGKLDQYSTCFDLNIYRNHRNNFMAETLISKNPLSREIVEYAREQHYAFPDDARLYAALDKYHLLDGIKAMKKLMRRLN